jgi:hypothetical protein
MPSNLICDGCGEAIRNMTEARAHAYVASANMRRCQLKRPVARKPLPSNPRPSRYAKDKPKPECRVKLRGSGLLCRLPIDHEGSHDYS